MHNWKKAVALAAMAGVSAGVLLMAGAVPGESQGSKKATIMSTTSVRGEVAPCG